MPVFKCPGNNKYRIGSGPCVFDTKEKAQKWYRAYLFKKYGTKASEQEGIDIPDNLGEESKDES